MDTRRDRILDEMRSCLRRGLPLPHRPDPRDIWESLEGDRGPGALLVMLEFEAAEKAALRELARAAA